METPPDPTDIVDTGRSMPARWRWLAVLALLGLAIVAIVQARRPGQPATAPNTPVATTPASVGPRPGDEPQIRVLGRPILDITDGWELFGFGEDQLVRIEFAAGRMTLTPVPVAGTGPVSLVVGPDWTFVRPYDFVPAFVVRDGHAPVLASGDLGMRGPALPGPGGRDVWVPSADGEAMVLVRMDGPPTGTSAALPPGADSFLYADGAGAVVSHARGGWFLLRSAGPSLITTGWLLAAGSTRWLVHECDAVGVCSAVVIDRATGSRHILAQSQQTPADTPPGVISPDGSRAALVEVAGAPPGLHLIDLTTGVDRAIDVPAVSSITTTTAWSPDGRWLFVTSSAGTVHAVAADTGAAVGFGVDLPPVRALATRDEPARPGGGVSSSTVDHR